MNPIFTCLIRLTLSASLICPTLHASELQTRTNLNHLQQQTLLAAKQDSRELEWRVFSLVVDGSPRTAVFLGEHHYAFAEDLRAAREPIDHFEYFATENGRTNDDRSYQYRTLLPAVLLLTPLTMVGSLLERRTSRSPMDLAKEGRRVKSVESAERLHQPSFGEEFELMFLGVASFAVFATAVVAAHSGLHLLLDARNAVHLWRFGRAALAFVGLDFTGRLWSRHAHHFPLLKNRDRSISEYVDGWMRTSGRDGPLMVILGQKHLHNCGRFLTSDYGFSEIALDPSPL